MHSKLQFQSKTLVISDQKMESLLQLSIKAAKTLAPVLICGESGTGKELIARFIHEKSSCAKGPFVSVNCAAIPEGLIESEFFGHEKGAFTGAIAQKIGKFERANGGTLLLDEVSEMPYPLQAKLLRVLQEGEVERLGGKETIPLNCRIIATTNRDPKELIAKELFREDLYYRLNVFRIDCLPLRGRYDAIQNLANYFSDAICTKYFLEPPRFTDSAIRKMAEYSWPGNIRELQNLLERTLLVSEKRELEAEDLLLSNDRKVSDSLEGLEEKMILKILEEENGVQVKAAARLGITPRTLRNKLKLYQEEGK